MNLCVLYGGSHSRTWDPVLLSFPDARTTISLGRFITFEGLDGCGKSTQLEKLAVVLRKEGVPFLITREPGGTATGEVIRNLLLDSATSGLSPFTELALMFASRTQHINEIIEPALSEGKVVLCDRFTDSTEAYQGGGRKLGSQPVLSLHRILVWWPATGCNHPDGLRRGGQRGACAAPQPLASRRSRRATKIDLSKKAGLFSEGFTAPI